MKDQKINKGGRKRLNIDLDEVERLAGFRIKRKSKLLITWAFHGIRYIGTN